MNRHSLPAKAYRKAWHSRYVPEAAIRALDRVLHLFHYHGVTCRGRNDHLTAGPPHHIIDQHRWLG